MDKKLSKTSIWIVHATFIVQKNIETKKTCETKNQVSRKIEAKIHLRN